MESDQLQQALGLIERIYRAVNHPDDWHATLAAIAAAIPATGCAIWVSDLERPEDGMLASTFADLELLDRHTRDYAHESPLFHRLAKMPPERAYTCAELMPREEFMQTPMYREFWVDSGLQYALGSFIRREKNRVAALWAYRLYNQPFTRQDAEFIDFLQPHLAQALALRSELLRKETLALTGMLALDRMSMAMLLLDDTGRPVAHNTHTETFVAQGLLQITDDALQLSGARNNRELAAFLQATRDVDSQTVVLAGGGFKLHYEGERNPEVEVLVLPYRSLDPQVESSLMAPISSIVFIKHVGSAPIPRDSLMRDLYGLTIAEAKVCVQLMDGATVKDIAEGQAVTQDAIRYHCKNILRKTGSSRQSDLIRTLSLSLVNMAGD
jgi:DNA-binding CsgD family transcriptional regulator